MYPISNREFGYFREQLKLTFEDQDRVEVVVEVAGVVEQVEEELVVVDRRVVDEQLPLLLELCGMRHFANSYNGHGRHRLFR